MVTQYENYTTPNGGQVLGSSGLTICAQTFLTTSEHQVGSIKLSLSRGSGYIGTVTVSIRDTAGGEPTGVDLCSGTYDMGYSVGDIVFDIYTVYMASSVLLSDAHTYAVILKAPYTSTATLYWYANNNSGYAGGKAYYSEDNGTTWIDPTSDFYFDIYGCEAPPVTLSTTPNVSCRGRVTTYKSGCNVLLDLTPDVACAGIATGRKAPVVLTSTPNVACAGVDD